MTPPRIKIPIVVHATRLRSGAHAPMNARLDQRPEPVFPDTKVNLPNRNHPQYSSKLFTHPCFVSRLRIQETGPMIGEVFWGRLT